jgi:hypothetical protein
MQPQTQHQIESSSTFAGARLIEGRTDYFAITTQLADQVLRMIPYSGVIGASPAGPEIAVPWTQQNCEILGSIGAPYLPRICVDYGFPGDVTPFPHQFRLSGFMSTQRRGYVLAEPRTGKTKSAAWAAHYLMGHYSGLRALIICPRSLMVSTWAAELLTSAPRSRSTVLYGTAEQRRKLVRQDTEWHIINPDGVVLLQAELLANNYDIVIIDESTLYKKWTNNRWTAARPIVKKAQWAWQMSGTPIPQRPTDAYGQLRLFLGRHDIPWSEHAFKLATMYKVNEHIWVPKIGWRDMILRHMQPAVRVFKRDVLRDLPPIVDTYLDVDLTSEQKTALAGLKSKHRTAEIGGTQITVMHEAALRIKLLQVFSGSVYDSVNEDDARAVPIDCSPRFALLDELINERMQRGLKIGPQCYGKVMICCAFRHTAARVAEHLRTRKLNPMVMLGGLSPAAVADKLRNFRETWDHEVIVVVPDALAHGHDITAANTLVWFTPVDKGEIYQQARERIDGPKQKLQMEVVHLVGHPLERQIYKQRSAQKADQRALMAGYGELVSAI